MVGLLCNSRGRRGSHHQWKQLFFLTCITFIFRSTVLCVLRKLTARGGMWHCWLIKKTHSKTTVGHRKRHEYTTQSRKGNGFNCKSRIFEKSVCARNSLLSLQMMGWSRQVTRVVTHPTCWDATDTFLIVWGQTVKSCWETLTSLGRPVRVGAWKRRRGDPSREALLWSEG